MVLDCRVIKQLSLSLYFIFYFLLFFFNLFIFTYNVKFLISLA